MDILLTQSEKNAIQTGWLFKGINIDIDTMVIAGVNRNDYPDFTDAYVSEMQDTNGNELSEEFLDAFTDEFNEFIHDTIISEGLY